MFRTSRHLVRCGIGLVGASLALAVAGLSAQNPGMPAAGAAGSPCGTSVGPPLVPAGDPARGKALFESSGCFDCHRVNDRGSHLGPDLSEIGCLRTPARLQQALVAPDDEVLAENRFVRFITKDGATVTGRLLNQDAVSVQLINSRDELKSYLRASLRNYTILDKGLMPSTQGKLSDQQVSDIVSYLSSLKPPEK
jgi:putative heme-binding domain-containing protein